jgi:hypothetical protein
MTFDDTAQLLAAARARALEIVAKAGLAERAKSAWDKSQA